MKRYRNGEIWDFEETVVGSNNYKRKVVLGLDGGTTSTVCVCMPFLPFLQPLPDPVPVLARAVAGCSNHNSVGEMAARETLEQVMADALSKSGSDRSAVQAVCLAVAGVNHPSDEQRILNWLRNIFPRHVRLYVQNDAVAALASGTLGKLHGCVLIAGTGTIAYGFTEEGKEARSAGAGPILGDWGSGYGIAAKALTAIIRAHDGRGPQTSLTFSVLGYLGLSSPDELIGWTYADSSWARIAALVPAVVSCAEAGDPVANGILQDSVEELALSVKAVVHRLRLCDEGVSCCKDEFCEEKVWKWQSTDIEIQRHVIRSVTSLLDCFHGDTSDHPLVKDSVADMVGALAWILKHKSASVLCIAAKAVVKLISTIRNSMLHPYLLDLVDPLSSLLSFPQLEISISCATALNMLLSNLSIRDEKMVPEILNVTVIQSQLINNLVRSFNGNLHIEYFKETSSLLSTLLHRWPSSRYAVWSDAKLMEVLKIFHDKPDISLAIPILNLCSALALCGHGAKKLLENAEMLLPTVVIYMGDSYSLSIRLEAFRLARHLVENEQGCLTVMRCYCEPFVEAIINGMGGWMTHLGKVPNEQMFLLGEACHLALVLRWPGKHHGYFWKQGIDRVLISLLFGDLHTAPSQQILSLEEQISIAKEYLQKNSLVNLRPYIWDILGWLAAHYSKDSNPNLHTRMDTLIICACLSFADSVCSGFEDLANAFRSESATRVALLMIYSPCRDMSSKVISVLSEVLKPAGKAFLKRIISTLNVQSLSDDIGMSDALQAGINLAALACYAALPEYKTHIVANGGIKTLMRFTRQCLNNNVHVGRRNLAPHLHNQFREKTCCLVNEDWEGNDILLLYGFMGLAELLHFGSVANVADIFAGQIEYTESQFISTLQDICIGTYSMGVKWYTAYILSYFDYYGFPSKIGNHIREAFNENKHVDIQLILAEGNSIDVHGVVLASRCPPLLPPESLASNKKSSGSSMGNDIQKQLVKSQKHIHLSSHVNNVALTKLLEFLYSGSLDAVQDVVKKLKVLARHCNLQSLLLVLGRKRPKWGIIWPSYDLTIALGSTGHCHSDIILVAKSTESMCWTCDICSTEVPHVHAHRIILWSRCDYIRALLESGMQESSSQTIKVPLSWEAMSKLVKWIYADELPNPPSGCFWDSMIAEEKLRALQPYLELCWLAGFWFLDEVKDISFGVVLSCLDSSKDLSIKIIQIAASLCLWNVAEVAAGYLAPSYHQLCHSGDLEVLDEELVEMIRDASVRFSQQNC